MDITGAIAKLLVSNSRVNFRCFFRRKNSPSFEDNFMWSLSIDV